MPETTDRTKLQSTAAHVATLYEEHYLRRDIASGQSEPDPDWRESPKKELVEALKRELGGGELELYFVYNLMAEAYKAGRETAGE